MTEPDLTLQLVGDHPWIVPLFGLCSVIVGGAIAFLTTYFIEMRRQQNTTEGIAKAIAAEIETGLRMFKFRRAKENLCSFHEAAQQGSPQIFRMDFGNEYLLVTKSSIKEIGSLKGDLPYLITEFLTLTNSLRLDIAKLNGMNEWANGQQALVDFYFQMLVIIDRGFEVGHQIGEEVAKHYSGFRPAPWNREAISKQ